MSTIAEQFSTIAKSHLETNLLLFTELTNNALANVEKLIDLNLNAAKASLENSNSVTQQLLAAKDPQEFLSLSAALAQPNTEKAIAYSRHLAQIASNTHADLTKSAEIQIAETKRNVIAFVDQVSKAAPSGSEGAIAFIKSAIGNANASYEQLAKNSKQVVETLENNVNSAVDQLSQAAIKHTARAPKK